MKVVTFNIPLKSDDRYSQPGTPIVFTNDSIQLLFTLTDTTAQELTGATATAMTRTKDNAPAVNAPIIDGNTVSYILADSEKHPGIFYFDFAIKFIDNTQLNSPIITLEIIESLKDKIERESA